MNIPLKKNVQYFLVNFVIICTILFVDISVTLEDDDFISHIKHRRITKRTATSGNCTQYEFLCKSNNKCIDKTIICDGVKDCADGSDETEALCKNVHCPGYSFRCKYGGCIDSTSKCDGRSDCADNSDETDLECPPLIADGAPSRHCKSTQFECISGRCIDKKLLCNGKRDCDDGSDETIRNCENMKCQSSQFQCKYGACINLKNKCDGVKHCPDGSDEYSQICQAPATPTPTPKPPGTPKPEIPDKSRAPGACLVPRATHDKKYTVNCPEETEKCDSRAGQYVPKFSELNFQCHKGYTHVEGDNFISICRNGSWYPPIYNCSRICKKLKPVNVDLTCYRKGSVVDCEGDLFAGTSVRPRCKPQHREEFPVFYRDITCQDDGEWTNLLFKCVPECGKPYANVTKLIVGGEVEKYGDSPWHVAIYNIADTTPTLICGGTIITPQLIASAAHCFYDEINNKPFNANYYEIAVSKVTRNYTIKDNGQTKTYKIREIFFSDKGYQGVATNYVSDIVIMWVAEKISLSRPVLPACMHWQEVSAFNPGEKTPGKIVGWGLDESGAPSEILLSANLPFISYAQCLKNANENFKSSITLDKFCAGSEKGAGARKGDSGGGIFFRDEYSGLFYLRGIVSIKDPSETSVAAFTDVGQYVDWISKIRNKVEEEEIKATTTLGSKT